ncbi:histidine acid phosphatase [Colletotrichum graminicola]|nr:histidine acid phosphatase [Colletotrichum graminicola]
MIREPKSHFWDWYSPYYPVPSEIDPAVPAGCKVTFVQVLSRHASRYPKSPEMERAKALLARVRTEVSGRVRPEPSNRETLEILMSNDLIPHEFEKLTPFGKKEAIDSGRSFFKRYQDLAAHNDPFMRSIDEDRVIETASLWKEGFDQSKGYGKTTRGMEIIPTTKGFNNSLHYGGCPAFDRTVSKIHTSTAMQWMNRNFEQIIARMNRQLPGVYFAPADIQRLMRLCPTNTVINGIESKVCNLFTTEEFRDTEYGNTIGQYYSWGPGNPLGVSQGVGFTNELIARLTGRPVVDHTSTNTTLTQNPATFPLNRKIYADFSRSNVLVSIYSAMGLFDGARPLSKTQMTPLAESGGFTMSRLIPFGSRMYVEKLQCRDEAEEMVRVLLNDRVMPLSSCGADRHGRCKLSNYVESLRFARTGGDWNKCFP